MDFDLRQWLLILGPLFIAGVLVHGYFRMRAGQNEIRMKLDKNFISQPGEKGGVDDLSLLKAELPNGGARVIGSDGLYDDALADESDEAVPMLMESVELPSSGGAPAMDEVPMAPSGRAPAAKNHHESGDASEKDHPEPVLSATRDEAVVVPSMSISAEPDARVEPVATQPEDAAVKAPPARRADAPEKAGKSAPKPEKFVVINVLALDEPFAGSRLQDILVGAGMAHGEMKIFHKLSTTGEPEFSLASAVEPGTFDLNEMSDFSTPGVTLFMRVHELSEPLLVLDDMLAVANAIAEDLHGEIRDDTRSVMTPQTIEHCRQSIRDFQFKHSA